MEHLFILIFISLVGWASYRGIRNWWQRRQINAKADRGRQMEDQAGDMLASLGYRPISQHPEISYNWIVNGQERAVTVTPDWVVKRDGKTYFVEVKTGNQANPNQAKTRRQLMEYFIFGDADGVIYFDADKEVAKLVSFPVQRRANIPSWMWILVLISIGTAIFSVWKLLSY